MVSLTDIFKKRATPKRGEAGKEGKALFDKKEKPEKVAMKVENPKPRKELKIGQGYRILKSPHVTEKATDLVEKNQYVFRVFPEANKIEMKKAIEDTYGVDVVSVRMINVPAKKRRLGKTKGVKAGYKKAIVRVKEGQKIEVLPR